MSRKIIAGAPLPTAPEALPVVEETPKVAEVEPAVARPATTTPAKAQEVAPAKPTVTAQVKAARVAPKASVEVESVTFKPTQPAPVVEPIWSAEDQDEFLAQLNERTAGMGYDEAKKQIAPTLIAYSAAKGSDPAKELAAATRGNIDIHGISHDVLKNRRALGPSALRRALVPNDPEVAQKVEAATEIAKADAPLPAVKTKREAEQVATIRAPEAGRRQALAETGAKIAQASPEVAVNVWQQEQVVKGITDITDWFDAKSKQYPNGLPESERAEARRKQAEYERLVTQYESDSETIQPNLEDYNRNIERYKQLTEMDMSGEDLGVKSQSIPGFALSDKTVSILGDDPSKDDELPQGVYQDWAKRVWSQVPPDRALEYTTAFDRMSDDSTDILHEFAGKILASNGVTMKSNGHTYNLRSMNPQQVMERYVKAGGKLEDLGATEAERVATADKMAAEAYRRAFAKAVNEVAAGRTIGGITSAVRFAMPYEKLMGISPDGQFDFNDEVPRLTLGEGSGWGPKEIIAEKGVMGWPEAALNATLPRTEIAGFKKGATSEQAAVLLRQSGALETWTDRLDVLYNVWAALPGITKTDKLPVQIDMKNKTINLRTPNEFVTDVLEGHANRESAFEDIQNSPAVKRYIELVNYGPALAKRLGIEPPDSFVQDYNNDGKIDDDDKQRAWDEVKGATDKIVGMGAGFGGAIVTPDVLDAAVALDIPSKIRRLRTGLQSDPVAISLLKQEADALEAGDLEQAQSIAGLLGKREGISRTANEADGTPAPRREGSAPLLSDTVMIADNGIALDMRVAGEADEMFDKDLIKRLPQIEYEGDDGVKVKVHRDGHIHGSQLGLETSRRSVYDLVEKRANIERLDAAVRKGEGNFPELQVEAAAGNLRRLAADGVDPDLIKTARELIQTGDFLGAKTLQKNLTDQTFIDALVEAVDLAIDARQAAFDAAPEMLDRARKGLMQQAESRKRAAGELFDWIRHNDEKGSGAKWLDSRAPWLTRQIDRFREARSASDFLRRPDLEKAAKAQVNAERTAEVEAAAKDLLNARKTLTSAQEKASSAISAAEVKRWNDKVGKARKSLKERTEKFVSVATGYKLEGLSPAGHRLYARMLDVTDEIDNISAEEALATTIVFELNAKRRVEDGLANSIDEVLDKVEFRLGDVTKAAGLKGDILYADRQVAPTFYNNAVKVVEAYPGKKPQSLATWRAMLKKGGVVEDEISWSKLDSFFEGRAGATKEEILDWLDRNGVRLEVKGMEAKNPYADKISAGHAELERIGRQEEALRGVAGDEANSQRAALMDRADEIDAEMTQWEAQERRWLEQNPYQHKQYTNYTLPGGVDYQEVRFYSPQAAGYRAPHFDSYGNDQDLLFHMRTNIRELPNGKRVLFIEEIQSDWHQAGRDKGYRADFVPLTELPEDVKGLADDLSALFVDYNDLYRKDTLTDAEFARATEIGKKIDVVSEQLEQKIGGRYLLPSDYTTDINQHVLDQVNRVRENKAKDTPPDAPFKDHWHRIAFKQALRMAAEAKVDGVAWTNGLQQVDRYSDDLRKQVDEIDWSVDDGRRRITARKNKAQAFWADVNASGRVVASSAEKAVGKPLADVLGKTLAKQVMGEEKGLLQGDDLTIGGEGMKQFYDNALPATVQKYFNGKGWGAKVERVPFRELPPKYTVAMKAGDSAEDLAERAFQVSQRVTHAPLAERMLLFRNGLQRELPLAEAWGRAFGTSPTNPNAKLLGLDVTAEPAKAASVDLVHYIDLPEQAIDDVLYGGQSLYQKEEAKRLVRVQRGEGERAFGLKPPVEPPHYSTPAQLPPDIQAAKADFDSFSAQSKWLLDTLAEVNARKLDAIEDGKVAEEGRLAALYNELDSDWSEVVANAEAKYRMMGDYISGGGLVAPDESFMYWANASVRAKYRDDLKAYNAAQRTSPPRIQRGASGKIIKGPVDAIKEVTPISLDPDEMLQEVRDLPWFHGTAKGDVQLKEYDVKIHSGTGAGNMLGPGKYLASNPERAIDYAAQSGKPLGSGTPGNSAVKVVDVKPERLIDIRKAAAKKKGLTLGEYVAEQLSAGGIEEDIVRQFRGATDPEEIGDILNRFKEPEVNNPPVPDELTEAIKAYEAEYIPDEPFMGYHPNNVRHAMADRQRAIGRLLRGDNLTPERRGALLREESILTKIQKDIDAYYDIPPIELPARFDDIVMKFDGLLHLGRQDGNVLVLFDPNGKINGRAVLKSESRILPDEVLYQLDDLDGTPLPPGTSSIKVDGIERPALNSNGQPIHPTIEGVENFWRWFGDSKVVDAEGRPLVVYHGTTHPNITQFKQTGNADGYLGQGPYFTSSAEDAAENYAGVGPDLTSRIEARADQIIAGGIDDGEMFDLLDEYYRANPKVKKVSGWANKNLDKAWGKHGHEAAKHAATLELKGPTEGLMMPVNIRLKNPADVRPGSKTPPLTYEVTFDDAGDLISEEGSLLDWIENARNIGQEYGVDTSAYIDALLEYGDAVDLDDAFRLVLKHLSDGYDDVGEPVTGGGIFRQIAEASGYDGIIMDADEHFGTARRGFGGVRVPGMKGVTPGTAHIVAFDSKSVKSAIGNKGTFSPDDPSILNQNAKAFVQFTADGKQIIHLMKTADFSSLVHEASHIFRRELSKKDNATVGKWVKSMGLDANMDLATGRFVGKDAVEAEERFARGFERYVREGKSPLKAMTVIYEKMKQWMLAIYKGIRPGSSLDVPLSPDIEMVFARMVTPDSIMDEMKPSVMGQKIAPAPGKPPVTAASWLSDQLKAKGIDMPAATIQTKWDNNESVTLPFKVGGKSVISSDDALDIQLSVDAVSRAQAAKGDFTVPFDEPRQSVMEADLVNDVQAGLSAPDTVREEAWTNRWVVKNVAKAASTLALGADAVKHSRMFTPRVREAAKQVERTLNQRIGDFNVLLREIRLGNYEPTLRYLTGEEVTFEVGGRRPLSAGHDAAREAGAIIDDMYRNFPLVGEDGKEVKLRQLPPAGAPMINPKYLTIDGDVTDNIAEAASTKVILSSVTGIILQLVEDSRKVSTGVFEQKVASFLKEKTGNGKRVAAVVKPAMAYMMEGSPFVRHLASAVFDPGGDAVKIKQAHEILSVVSEARVFTLISALFKLNGGHAVKNATGGFDVAFNYDLTSRQKLDAFVSDLRHGGFSVEEVNRALAIVNVFGSYTTAYKGVEDVGYSFTKAQRDIHRKFLSGQIESPAEYAEGLRMFAEFGYNWDALDEVATMVEKVPTLRYIPADVQGRLGAALGRALDEETQGSKAIAESAGKPPAWMRQAISLFQRDLARGLVIAKSAKAVMDLTDTWAMNVVGGGLQHGSTVAVRQLYQTIFATLQGHVLSKAASLVSQGAGRGPVSSDDVRQLAQRLGDLSSDAVALAKVQINTNAILKGTNEIIDMGDGRKYRASDLLKVAIQQGTVASFESSEIRASVRQSLEMKLDKDGNNLVQAAMGAKNAVGTSWQQWLEANAELFEALAERERINTMIVFMQAGKTPTEAAALTTKILFDYPGSLAKAETKSTWTGLFLTAVHPFWTWQKNANHFVINALENPVVAYRMGVMRRAIQTGPEAVSQAIYTMQVDPYGFDPERMPAESRKVYYHLRQAYEESLGKDAWQMTEKERLTFAAFIWQNHPATAQMVRGNNIVSLDSQVALKTMNDWQGMPGAASIGPSGFVPPPDLDRVPEYQRNRIRFMLRPQQSDAMIDYARNTGQDDLMLSVVFYEPGTLGAAHYLVNVLNLMALPSARWDAETDIRAGLETSRAFETVLNPERAPVFSQVLAATKGQGAVRLAQPLADLLEQRGGLDSLLVSKRRDPVAEAAYQDDIANGVSPDIAGAKYPQQYYAHPALSTAIALTPQLMDLNRIGLKMENNGAFARMPTGSKIRTMLLMSGWVSAIDETSMETASKAAQYEIPREFLPRK